MFLLRKPCFNSTLVQLKSVVKFLRAFGLHRFNSTLVQLKISNACYVSTGGASFNSTLVQLKTNSNSRIFAGKSCFNSTLVQLKSSRLNATKNDVHVFQFHFGSIKKTADIAPKAVIFIGFQFHFGSIKNRSRRSRSTIWTLFQFHFGSIKKRAFRGFLGYAKFVSIPLWFN